MIRLIIADDQLLFRSMLEEMLEKDAEIEIAASCSNGGEAVSQALKLKPDVILLDIQMPNKGGIEALKEIKSSLPDTKVAMLTTFENDENIKSACLLGADGYLLKELKPDILLMAVKCIYHDIVLFHRGVYTTLLSSGPLQSKAAEQRFEFGSLVFDSVDISIMKLISLGKSNRDIAAALNYSEGTIKNRVSKILSTTGLSDRTEISVFAIKNQII
jgi:DNA-binding NarL/FixJ family response regulator